ncbi:MAG: hypothetical protein ACRC2S_16780 [Waterburya sp.]
MIQYSQTKLSYDSLSVAKDLEESDRSGARGMKSSDRILFRYV